MNIKLHKNGTYYAHIKTEHGQQEINLKTKSRKEAVQLAKDAKLEELERAALINALTAETVVRITAGRKLTCDDALTQWITWGNTVGLTPNTIERYRSYVYLFFDEFKLHDRSITSVKPEQIDQFVNPVKSDIKASTRMSRLNALQSFFMVCATKGLTVGDPAATLRVKMHTLTFAQKEPTEKRIFNADELKRLRSVDDPFWRVASLLGQRYGYRISDVAQLEWASFSKRGKIIVWTDKHDHRIELSLHADVEAAVAELPKLDARYVFPKQAELAQDTRRRSTLSTYFARILKREGIEGKSFHSFRHTFATEHTRLGASIDEIRVKLGHVLPSTTEGYIHV